MRCAVTGYAREAPANARGGSYVHDDDRQQCHGQEKPGARQGWAAPILREFDVSDITRHGSNPGSDGCGFATAS